jgi:heptosyltransferase III
MTDAPRRGLVLRRGGLGDTLLLVPVLRALARARPDLQFELAGVREFAAVLAAHDVVTAAHSSEDLALWSATMAPLRLRPFAHVCSDDPAVATFAPAGTVVQVYDPRPARDEPLPLQLAAQLGLELQWPQDAWLARRQPPAGPTVLAPGSGARSKCWPRAHWLALAALLAAHGERCTIVVGPTEQEHDDPRRWPWPPDTTFLAELTAVELAQRLATARAFVGNDSGPSHLAALLEVPTVVLFGGGQPAVYAPVGPHVEVLLAPDRELQALSPAVVLVAWQRAARR